jgi:DNA-binding response OmpR family regulator/cellulose synthase/poly-beta-1,6-N-acetylglucosamine synthase-like glycosyltransferase
VSATRILVVEDNLGLQKMVGEFLRLRGYEVVIAGAGVDALDRAHAQPPDLVITDINMPRMSGVELIGRLRSEPAFASVPIIVLSALLNEETVRAGYAAGADTYLSKPVRLVELAETVERLVRRLPPVAPAPVASSPNDALILVVEDDVALRKLVTTALGQAGYAVVTAIDGVDALAQLERIAPDLIISDIGMPRLDGIALLRRIRADPLREHIPFLILSGRDTLGDRLAGLDLGADDYITKPVEIAELLARTSLRLRRRPVPASAVGTDARTGLASRAALAARLSEGRIGNPEQAFVALLEFDEIDSLRDRIGGVGVAEIERQVTAIIGEHLPGQFAARVGPARFGLILEATAEPAAMTTLEALLARLTRTAFRAGDEEVHLTPACGITSLADGVGTGTRGKRSSDPMLRAESALAVSRSRRDVLPVRYVEGSAPAAKRRRLGPGLVTLLQIVFMQVLTLGGPYAVYVAAAALGRDISHPVFVVVVVALLVTSLLVTFECLLALKSEEPAPNKGRWPLATAVIAAYLPNEAATLVGTLRSFLANPYPGGLEVILAYNTPRDMPVEDELRRMAAADRRLVLLRVEGSTSKAQNVNAAVAQAHGAFVGVFDADHHPDPDAFDRAWRHIQGGADIVQGHCVVRNGRLTWVTRLVAVEFEVIYAVSHRGRARMHGFGIFGGSNGYWRTELLRESRMRHFMLTEDIDSSVRALTRGKRIVYDPRLKSRELAPATLQALWNQRLRWAQGWFQVSLRHGPSSLRAAGLTLRQRLGMAHLLIWREVYPWLALQVLPIIAFWAQQAGGLDRLDWGVPVLVLAAIVTFVSSPVQTVCAYVLADPAVRSHRRWFVLHLLAGPIFMQFFKTVIVQIAQLRQLTGDNEWRITPRTDAT